MGQAERIHEEAVVAGQATAKYRSRGVPSDWYVDPADPDAAERYNLDTTASLQDQATAFLAEHEALLGGQVRETKRTSTILRWSCGTPGRGPWRSRSGSDLPAPTGL